MKNFKILLSLCCFLILSLIACKEEFPSPISQDGEVSPVVKNIKVENVPGGAKLKYDLPESTNLLYVKAVFEYPKGTFRDVIASGYTDSLLIEGIGDTNELNVKLYSVNRSEVSSAPVSVIIKPLESPVKLAAATMKLNADFGGVTVSFVNASASNIVITIIRKDGDEWLPIETLYTSKSKGTFTARGQSADSQMFGVYIKDRWNNLSDTLMATLSPFFEEKLASPTPVLTLYGDYNLYYKTFDHNLLFDGSTTSSNYYGTLLAAGSKLPLSFTLDFGKPKSFSRLKLWQRHHFANGSPEVFEIWGANELNDDWSKWEMIVEFTSAKPSGLGGAVTDEDRAFSTAGIDFNFPAGTPKYRYLRWRSTKNFGSVDYIQMSEVTFFGSEQ